MYSKTEEKLTFEQDKEFKKQLKGVKKEFMSSFRKILQKIKRYS